MPSRNERDKQIPLRVVRPSLYVWVRAKFAEAGLRSYDFVATVADTTEMDGQEFIICFGENLDHCRKQVMPLADTYEQDANLAAFMKETVALCKASVMDDYRAAMKGRSSV